MIGKVLEGRYVGASICKLPDKNVLFIETEDGERIALSKKNVISIDDVTDQYPSYGGKVMMVMWNDFETSIVQIGIQQSDRNALNKEGIISSPLPVKQEVRAGRKNSKKTLLVFLGIVVLISVCIFLADRLINNNHKDTPHLEHTWLLATCETPKTCKECGITQGTAIDHTYKSEVVVEPNYLSLGTNKKTCVDCGHTIQSYVYLEKPYYFWNMTIELDSSISIGCVSSKRDNDYIMPATFTIFSSQYSNEELLQLLSKYDDAFGFDGKKLHDQIERIMSDPGYYHYDPDGSHHREGGFYGPDLDLTIGEHGYGSIHFSAPNNKKLEEFLGINILEYAGNEKLYTPRIREETNELQENISQKDDDANLDGIESLDFASVLYDESGRLRKADEFIEIYDTILSTAYKRYYGKTLSIRKAPGSQLSNSYGIYIDGEPSGAMINFMYKGDDTPADNSFDQIIVMAYTDSGDDTGSNIFCLTTLMSAAKPTVSDVMDSTSIFEEMLYELNEPGVDFSEYTVQGVKYKMSILPVENRPTIIFSIDISALQ